MKQTERISRKIIIEALLVHLLAVFRQQIVKKILTHYHCTSVFFWLRNTSDSP